MSKAIRWRQRFQNYASAFRVLARTVALSPRSEAERGGLIQFFETTFELGWKLLKDYLEAQGVVAISPREAIKHAYQMTLIANGQGWLEALEDRNLIAHTYDEATCLKLERLIADKYFPLLQALHDTFNSKAE